MFLGAPEPAGRENRKEAFSKVPDEPWQWSGAGRCPVPAEDWEYSQRCFPAGKMELWFFGNLCPGQGIPCWQQRFGMEQIPLQHGQEK